MALIDRSAFVLASLFALGTLATGCTTPRTEVIVSVNSDIASLDSIRIDVTAPRGRTQSSTAMLGGGEPGLPRTLGLAWTGGDLGPYVVRVAGISGGAEVVQRVADFQFQRGQTRVLLMDLHTRCVGFVCGGGQTCGDDGCRVTTIDASELRTYTPGVTADVDGGTPGSDGGSCVPGTETCDAADDDCDGNVDEDFDFMNDENNCGMCGRRCRGFADTCCDGTCANRC